MPSATLSIPPLPENVRTARLVAVAAARRAGLDEETVDDVRLAVGETVARAVLRCASSSIEDPVEIVLRDDGAHFEVEVLAASGSATDDDDDLARALVRALVPDAELSGDRVRLVWPRGALS
jgi:anti-sigma regulatory factor (Ser/Thr protein kinase)